MALKGVNDNYTEPVGAASFRHGGWFQPEGGKAAYIHEARVVDVNFVNWTVDVRTQFDKKDYFDVQIASPYMHPNHGEGIYAMPEVNAKCLVCIPSDGPPPFVLAFIMPAEDQTGEAYKGDGFAGGRKRAKSGDIYLKGRDGQFITLHRGGVLEIGATPVAKRIYIPLQNVITDISQQYEHHNSCGSINWGISSSSTDENPETEFVQTFRLFANDERADVRLAIGKVHQPTPEPAGDAGSVSLYNDVVDGKPVAVELTIAPGGFDAGTGALGPAAQGGTKLKLLFSRDGGAFMRAEGKVGLRVKKKMQLDVDDDFTLNCKGVIKLNTEKKIELRTEAGIDISSTKGVVRLNGGTKPIATVGSTVMVIIKAPIPIIVDGKPGTILTGAVMDGTIKSGNPTLLG